ncbi:MAG: hypothetical protein ACJAQ3_004049, partial [Planctomycetota bacterium]
KSQLVLRSMDMDGRSLGTERSSTFPGGRSQAESASTIHQALGDGNRFAAMLKKSADSGVKDVASAISARIREGRTDAADRTYNSRDAQAQSWKPREERTVSRGDESSSGTEAGVRAESGKGAQKSGRGARESSPTSTADAPDTSSPLDEAPGEVAPESVAAEPDPSDAQGQAAPTAVPLADSAPMGSSSTLTAGGPAASGAAATSQVAVAMAAATQAAGSKGSPLQPAQSIQPAAAAKAARGVEGPAAPRASVPPEEARAILDQIRVQILDGKREARIQLRPIELGRLDMLIRVDGSAVSARIAVESPETLSLLEAHAPELRAWLAQDGAESVELEFSLIDPDSTEFAHDGDPAQSAPDGGARSDRSAARGRSGTSLGSAPTALDPADLLPALVRRVAEGGVDFVA